MLGRKPLACFCLVALAACGPENGLESASPAALWEGDNLLVLDADLDPDRANLQIAVADAWVGVTSITHFGVVNAGRIALRIEQVEVPPEVVVAIPPGVQPAARAEVAVHRVAAEDGAFRSLVDLATNDPKYPLLRIRLVGRALSVDDPNTEEPEDPGTEEPEDPGTEEPEDPGTEEPGDPPAACWDRTDALRSERKIDVLWVLDNSDVSEIFRLPDLFRPFLSSASQLDYQIGITTNGITPAGGCPGGANGGENGRLFPVDGSTPRIITSAMPVALQEGAWRVNTRWEIATSTSSYTRGRGARSPRL